MHAMPATIAALALAVLVPSFAQGAVIGQIDTFEDGTTEGWFAGRLGTVPPVPPHVVDGGGPGGADDGFLEITAVGGSAAGSRLAAMNGDRWAGDYRAAGIRRITMDLANLGPSDLTIRLVLEDPTTAFPENAAVTSLGVVLPAGSGWTHVAFEITPAQLTALQGTVMAALEGATYLRILHAPSGMPEPVVGVLGVDNIAATPIPGGIALVASALLGFVAMGARQTRRRRRKWDLTQGSKS